MIRGLHFVLLALLACTANAQLPVDSIAEADISRMLTYLASDSLKGRGDCQPELQVAAHYIEQVFMHAGLKKLLPEYVQSFTAKEVQADERIRNTVEPNCSDKPLFNVVAMLPGKTLPGEIVLFSAHYDHLGVVKDWGRDSIFNGANDNASGTAGLLALASYYAKRADNERTLVFCAFGGEELGLLGSQYFVQNFNTGAIKAVVNIEMIGRATAVGKRAVFITGADQSTFASIFKKHIGKTIAIRNEPDVEKQLFMRSDNYPFALQGIPAHTIMCSDDSDPYYHRADDEVRRIDVQNMSIIIRAIASGCKSIIAGTDTPRQPY